MRFLVDTDPAHEALFVDAARMAGHTRAHDKATPDFFVIQSHDLVDPMTGRTVPARRLESAVGGSVPRLEIQVVDPPAHRDGVGTFGVVNQIVDGSGKVLSLGFAGEVEDLRDAFSSFLLEIGDLATDGPSVSPGGIPDSVEEFLTIWARVAAELPLDDQTRRIADALSAMVGEVVKTDDPPRRVLRAAFEWFGGKIDRFAEEFAASAGKTLGATAGLGAGAAVTGQLPRLVSAVDKVLTRWVEPVPVIGAPTCYVSRFRVGLTSTVSSTVTRRWRPCVCVSFRAERPNLYM